METLPEIICVECGKSLNNQSAHARDKGIGLICDQCHKPMYSPHHFTTEEIEEMEGFMRNDPSGDLDDIS